DHQENVDVLDELQKRDLYQEKPSSCSSEDDGQNDIGSGGAAVLCEAAPLVAPASDLKIPPPSTTPSSQTAQESDAPHDHQMTKGKPSTNITSPLPESMLSDGHAPGFLVRDVSRIQYHLKLSSASENKHAVPENYSTPCGYSA
ncbi:unnamed protein product, partial [Amoebophrya sp. A120]